MTAALPRKLYFLVGGLGGPDCANRVEQAVLHFRAVRYAGVSFSRGLMMLSTDDVFDVEEALAAVRAMGFSVTPNVDGLLADDDAQA